MQIKFYILFTVIAFLYGCDNSVNHSNKQNSVDLGKIHSTDLLNENSQREAVKLAVNFEDLSFSESIPEVASYQGKLYSGWVIQSEENNKISGIAYLKNGTEDGPILLKHANGQPSASGFYRNGKKSGKWTFWNDSGRVIEEKDL